jgi:hypothetical protein
MLQKTKALPRPDRAAELTQRLDPSASSETVITLATSADRHRLRSELLRLIIKSEAQRKRTREAGKTQEVTTTEGSANSPTEAAEA